MITIQTLASDMRSHMEQRTRDNGDRFWTLTDSRPDWMQDVAHTAHGDMMPDDWRYAFIVEALDAIDEHENLDDARDSIDADIYTHDLIAWLGSHGGRPMYCDEANEEIGLLPDATMIDRIQAGQYAEKMETFDLLVSALESIAAANDELEDEDES